LTALQPANSIAPEIQDLILSATVQIMIFPPTIAARTANEGVQVTTASQDPVSETVIVEQGLGTLVDLSGEIMIVTHNHWTLIEHPGKVQFSNTLGELLLEINGTAFQELIRYSNAGMLVLASPVELRPDYLAVLAARSKLQVERITKVASVGEVQALRPGVQVVVPHQSREDRNRITLLPAVVDSLITEEGLPAIKLRSLNGEVIINGDSGGGIWLDGRLVGDMWKSDVDFDWRMLTLGLLEPATHYTDTSYAAILPAEFQGLGNMESSNSTEITVDRVGGMIEN
jgi:hypothetical protein